MVETILVGIAVVFALATAYMLYSMWEWSRRDIYDD